MPLARIMIWTLHPASLRDFDTLIVLVEAFHAEAGIDLEASRRAAGLVRLLREPALGGVWIIRHAEQTAGYIALCVGFSLEFGGHDAFIDEIYLLPEQRGQGGGKAALSAIQPLARQRGVWALHLEVARDNTMARKLYAGSGLVAREKYVLMSVAL
jgi:GNAT superfamily N-acetyltransferase